MGEHVGLVGDGQQFWRPAPALPEVETQEVYPLSYVDDPGLGFIECQAAFL